MQRETPLSLLFENQLKALPGHQAAEVRENFFTASLAATLASSLPLRRRFVELLVGARLWRGERVGLAEIEVRPHEGYRTADDWCRPDLVLTINAKRKIAVEIKLDAPEGIDASGRRQVDRYLRLKDIHHVAFITASHVAVSRFARGKRGVGRYLTPRDAKGQFVRDHFLWSDFYPAVQALARGPRPNPLVVALLGLFDRLGFQPEHPLIGDLGGRTPFAQASREARASRARLQAALEPLGKALKAKQWSVSTVRNNGQTFVYPPDPRDWKVWLSANIIPGVFRIWINVDSPTEQRELAAKLPRALGDRLTRVFGWDVAPIVLAPSGTTHEVVEIWLPFRTLLRGLRRSDGVGRRLVEAATNTILAADRVAPGPRSGRRARSSRGGSSRRSAPVR